MGRLALPLFIIVSLCAALPVLLGWRSVDAAGVERADRMAPDPAAEVSGPAVVSDARTRELASLPEFLRLNTGPLGTDARLYAGVDPPEAIFHLDRFLLVARGKGRKSAVLRFTLEGVRPGGEVIGTLSEQVVLDGHSERVYGGVRYTGPWPDLALEVELGEGALYLSAFRRGLSIPSSHELRVTGTSSIGVRGDGSVVLVTGVGQILLIPVDGLLLTPRMDGTIGLKLEGGPSPISG